MYTERKHDRRQSQVYAFAIEEQNKICNEKVEVREFKPYSLELIRLHHRLAINTFYFVFNAIHTYGLREKSEDPLIC